MKGTRTYYEEFGKAKGDKAFAKNRESKTVPSKEKSKEISCDLEIDLLLAEIGASLTPYLPQTVCEQSVVY
jgi:hypothetical protein